MSSQTTVSEVLPTSTWRDAINLTIPLAMGYIPAAMAYGVLSSAANIPDWITIFISIVIFSGAAQYAAVQPVATGASVLDLLINTFAINIRHIFYALPLMDALPKSKIKKTYCLFCLTDEGFSLLTTLPKEKQKVFFVKVSALLHIYWILGTILGVLAGHQLGKLIPNLEFALTALFTILWYEQWKQKKIVFPMLIAVPAFLLAYLAFPQALLILSLMITIIGIIIHYIYTKRTN